MEILRQYPETGHHQSNAKCVLSLRKIRQDIYNSTQHFHIVLQFTIHASLIVIYITL